MLYTCGRMMRDSHKSVDDIEAARLRALWASVLLLAYQDAWSSNQRADGTKLPADNARRRARLWIKHSGGFQFCCETLSIDPGKTRTKMLSAAPQRMSMIFQ